MFIIITLQIEIVESMLHKDLQIEVQEIMVMLNFIFFKLKLIRA
jgi:hypothetical protein